MLSLEIYFAILCNCFLQKKFDLAIYRTKIVIRPFAELVMELRINPEKESFFYHPRLPRFFIIIDAFLTFRIACQQNQPHM